MKIKEIKDKDTWEKFITEVSPQSFFQSWNWGEVEKKLKIKNEKLKINLWRLGLYDRNKLVGIAQVEKVCARRGSFLHIRHGPILLSFNKKNFGFLINFLEKLAKKDGAAFIRVGALIEDTDKNRQLFKSFGFVQSPIQGLDAQICLVLDLEQTLNKIMQDMRKTTRQAIKKAINLGCTIKKSKNIADIDSFLSIYHRTASRHGFYKHRGIKEEFACFLKDDQVLLFKGYDQDNLLAGALIIFYNHQAIYHHSASIPSPVPINQLLQWEAIMEAKKRKKKIYNLYGIAPEDKIRHPWRGLTIFKKGFGGKVVKYIQSQDLPVSPLYYKTWVIEYIRKVWKGY